MSRDIEQSDCECGKAGTKVILPTALEMMKNCLGLNIQEEPYRNHYATAPSSRENDVWANLVHRGLAEVTSEPSATNYLRYYKLTESGKNITLKEVNKN